MTSAQDFWTRRRAAVEAEEKAAEREMADAAAQERETALAAKSDEALLSELGLPDPDNISLGDDVKAFMGGAVPERLRRRALRSLWRSNPVLACVDGLNDYDEDFNSAAENVTVFKTAYQVGKGLLRHTDELGRQAETNQPDLRQPVGEDPPQAAMDEATVEVAAQSAELERPDTETSFHPRRMAFSFEGSSE